MTSSLSDQLLDCLASLYSPAVAGQVHERLSVLLLRYAPRLQNPRRMLDQSDAILITYGDQVQMPGLPPLRVLAEFCHERLANTVSCVHILPFYPYSSDDGFSVIDYRQVNPSLGDWHDIARLGQDFRLMFDLVVNHISTQSAWFQGFLQDDPRYRSFFITVDDRADLSQVVRPRALPLLTHFATSRGVQAVWTTFSEDQVDLNYKDPQVLLEVIETLLFYVSQGAELIRLDAIAYLWKESGSTCIHLPQTHRIVQLLRLVLDQVAPWVQLITETNVPHKDNISYFGNGYNEAQLVYNFTLPPLVLHTLHTGDCRPLSNWIDSLELPSGQTTFFNFLASHDGIGLNPLRGILPEEAIQALVDKTIVNGGLVSYKDNPDGTRSPYELNINYFDALWDPGCPDSIELQFQRFIAAHALMFSLVGVPGIYFHSLFGSRGWPEGVAQTGRNRTINRQKLDRKQLETEMADPDSLRARVFQSLARLLRARASHPAFHPHGTQRVLDAGKGVFTLLRTAPDQDRAVLCLVNVTARPAVVDLDLNKLPIDPSRPLVDLYSNRRWLAGNPLFFRMRPYRIYWFACTGKI
jgi:glycosidase